MSAVKLSVIRSRLKTAIENISGGGLNESPLPFQAFGRTPNAIDRDWETFKTSDNSDSRIHILEDWKLILLVGPLFWLCGRPPSHLHPYHSGMIAVSIGTHRI